MCVIVDSNTLGRLKNPDDEDMEPVRHWLTRKNGKIVYSNTGKFKTEWRKAGMENWSRERNRANQFKLVIDGVQEKEEELKGKIKSDDEHIIALALVAGVDVLVSYSEGPHRGRKNTGAIGDRKLFDDFRDRNLVGGKVYTRKEHQHMLTRDTCP